MDDALAQKKKQQDAKVDRQKYLNAILDSKSRNKIVVAGPGTGKTFLFKKILEGKKKNLTLTFVNSLVEDLSLDLCGLSEVRTLHSYARSLIKGAEIFPKLSAVIRQDAKILLGEDIDFDKIFHERDDKNKFIPFYASRLKYYGYYGYTDIIFAAVRRLEKDRDKIPSYEQVLVDEFQDFNQLEVSLIDLLSEKSPILLAGDDDQALYEFKHASAKHIRTRHGNDFPNYEPFTLPYCSRCTRVIVEAINDILNAATEKGFLKGRIQKQYLYFDDEHKDQECRKYPTLTYTQIVSTQFAWFIANQLAQIAKDVRSKFSILVICPTKTQCRSIAETLREKGFKNVSFEDGSDDDLDLKEGLKLLLQDLNSNLGWRIAAESMLDTKEFKAVLEKTSIVGGETPPKFGGLVDSEHRKKARKLVAALRKIRDGDSLNNDLYDELFGEINLNARTSSAESLKSELESDEQRGADPAIRRLPIKITTIQSSKGLADDFVFIANFDDRYLVKDPANVTDREICNFLVALTRARKKVFLISSQKREPTFLQWIAKERVSPA